MPVFELYPKFLDLQGKAQEYLSYQEVNDIAVHCILKAIINILTNLSIKVLCASDYQVIFSSELRFIL